QASGSFSADGPSAPAPQAKCTKTADPDPKIPPACKPPPIRDRKTESANPRYGEGFFSKLLEHIGLILHSAPTCVTRGLDPRVHHSSQEFLRRGWIAGSSPAMTKWVKTAGICSRSYRGTGLPAG